VWPIGGVFARLDVAAKCPQKNGPQKLWTMLGKTEDLLDTDLISKQHHNLPKK
jgi:hypothetical protein